MSQPRGLFLVKWREKNFSRESLWIVARNLTDAHRKATRFLKQDKTLDRPKIFEVKDRGTIDVF